MSDGVTRGVLRLAVFYGILAASAPCSAQGIFGSGDSDVAEEATISPRADRKPVDTLMFSIDEFNQIQGRLAGNGSRGSKTDSGIENANLYLSSILYSGPKDWTIWVNGRPISPNEELQSIQVTAITPDYVELLVPLSAQGMRPVRLAPNQTFIAKSGTVVEGPLP
jgi:hypothetical protein